MNCYQSIYNAVRCIPEGKVATYGDTALTAGLLHGARTVGRALHVNPDPATIPCHRVVFSDGSLAQSFAFGGACEQQERLMSEGIRFINGKVDMQKFRWKKI